MTKFFRIGIFFITCVIGITATSSASLENWRHHECPRFGNIDPSERFFTFTEGKEKIGRIVHSKQSDSFPQNSGRAVSVDLVETNKFFVVVYWETSPEGDQHVLRYYSRDAYESILAEE